LGTITGGEAPILKIATTVKKTAGGFLCPETAGWDAEYVVTEPHAVYIGPAPASALFTDSEKTVRYSSGTVVDFSLKSGSSAKLTNSGGETLATCTGSTAKGKASNEGGQVAVVNLETLSWSACNQTTDTLTSGSLEFAWTSGSSGEVIGVRSRVTMQIFGVSCIYGFGTGTTLGTITGGEAPTLKIEAPVNKTAAGFLCPEPVSLQAEYVVTEPHALYVG
jgi:hypothetical protein